MSDASAISAADAAAAEAMAALALNAAAAGGSSVIDPTSASAAPPTRCILTEQSVTLLSLICRCLDAGSLLSAYHSCRALSAAASHPLTFQHDIRLCVKRLSAVQLSGPKATFHSPSTFARAIQSKLLRHFRILKLHAREASVSLMLSLLEPMLQPSCPPLHALTIDAASLALWGSVANAAGWMENAEAPSLLEDNLNASSAAANANAAAGAGAGMSFAPPADVDEAVYAATNRALPPRVKFSRGQRGVQTAKAAFMQPQVDAQSLKPIRFGRSYQDAEQVRRQMSDRFIRSTQGSSALVHRLFDFAANPSLSFLRVLAVSCSFNFAAESPLLSHLPPSLELLQLRIIDAAEAPPARIAPGSALVHPHWILPPALPSALAVLPRFVHLIVEDGGTSDLSSAEHFRSSLVETLSPQRGTHLEDLRTLQRIVESCPGLEAISWLVPVDLQRLDCEAAAAAVGGGPWQPVQGVPSVRKLFDVVCTWLPPVALPATPAPKPLVPAVAAAPAPAAARVNDDPLSSLLPFFPDLRSVSFASYHAPRGKAVEEDDPLPLWPSGFSARMTELQATVHRDVTEPLPSLRRMIRHIACGSFTALHSLSLVGNKHLWSSTAEGGLPGVGCFDLGLLLASLPNLLNLSIPQIRVDSLREFRRAPKLQSLRGLTWPYSAQVGRGVRDLHPDLDLTECFPALTSLEVSHALEWSPRAQGGLALQALLSLLPKLKWVKWAAASGVGFLHPLQLDSQFARMEAIWAADASKRAEKRAVAEARAIQERDRFRFQMDMMVRVTDQQITNKAWEWMNERLKAASTQTTAIAGAGAASANAGAEAEAGAAASAGAAAAAASGAAAAGSAAASGRAESIFGGAPLVYVHSSHADTLKAELAEAQRVFNQFHCAEGRNDSGRDDESRLLEIERTREELTKTLREKQQQWDRFQKVREIEAEMIKTFFPAEASAANAQLQQQQQAQQQSALSTTPPFKSNAAATPSLKLSAEQPKQLIGSRRVVQPRSPQSAFCSNGADCGDDDSSDDVRDRVHFEPMPAAAGAGAGAGVGVPFSSLSALGVKRGTGALAHPRAEMSEEARVAKQTLAAQRRAEAEANRAAKQQQREEQRQKQQLIQQAKPLKQAQSKDKRPDDDDSSDSDQSSALRRPVAQPQVANDHSTPKLSAAAAGAGAGGNKFSALKHLANGGRVPPAFRPSPAASAEDEVNNPFLLAIQKAFPNPSPKPSRRAGAGGAGIRPQQEQQGNALESAAASALFAFGAALSAAPSASAPAAPFSFGSHSFGAAPAAAAAPAASPFTPFAASNPFAPAAAAGAAPPGGPVFAFGSPAAPSAAFAPFGSAGGAGAVNPFLIPQGGAAPAAPASASVNPFATQPAAIPFAFKFAVPSAADAAAADASSDVGSAVALANAAAKPQSPAKSTDKPAAL